MAAKKIYAVKKGTVIGLFHNWDNCKKAVDGFPGAQYKGFTTIEEACSYMGIEFGGELPWLDAAEVEKKHAEKADKKTVEKHIVNGDSGALNTESSDCELIAYVDGSYEHSILSYAFGCVFLLPDGRIYVQYGNGNDEQSRQHRNVTGEMLGSMYAVKAAIMSGYKSIEIRYDYEGIEKWVTGAWKAKAELTAKYAASMREWSKYIRICFTKVAAHTNVKYNELADQMAKKGLVDGEGVPKVCKIEEMTLWNPAD